MCGLSRDLSIVRARADRAAVPCVGRSLKFLVSITEPAVHRVDLAGQYPARPAAGFAAATLRTLSALSAAIEPGPDPCGR